MTMILARTLYRKLYERLKKNVAVAGMLEAILGSLREQEPQVG